MSQFDCVGFPIPRPLCCDPTDNMRSFRPCPVLQRGADLKFRVVDAMALAHGLGNCPSADYTPLPFSLFVFLCTTPACRPVLPLLLFAFFTEQYVCGLISVGAGFCVVGDHK